MTFDDACRIVIAECPDAYAKSYASAGIGMTGKDAGIQSLYILSNASTWRGERAKEVKAYLRTLDPYKRRK